MSKGRKIALGIVLLFLCLLVALSIVIPILIDVDRYRPEVAAYIQEETGKPTQIGRLALTLFPAVSIRVDNFTLGNPPGFPTGTFLEARRIYAEVDPGALWNRQVLIKSLEIDKPVINLLSDVRGRWNFENSPKQRAVKAYSSEGATRFSLGVISKVKISGGELSARNLLSSGHIGPTYFDAHSVSTQLEQVNLNSFVAAASTPPGAVQALTAMLPGDGLGASIAYAAIPASEPAATGTLKAGTLRFGTLEVTGVKSVLRLYRKQVFLDGLRFDLYGGQATGDLSFNFAGQNPRYLASARVSGVDVAKLLAAFPGARGKMTGKMEGNFKLMGEVIHSPDPLAGMQGGGLVTVRNGQLPSLQLNKNLMLLARLNKLGAASGDPSSFTSISADLNIANQRITSHKVTMAGNGIAVDGVGSLALAGAGNLDYDGTANIDAGQNPLTNVLVNLSGATMANGKLSFPFHIAGTLENPRFLLKSAGAAGSRGLLQNLAGGAQQQGATQSGQTQPQPGDLIQGISGLFKKKQPQQPQPSQPKP